jgi:hypothetical protein
MTFLSLSSAPSALEAAWIFFVICGCVTSGWALGFGMGYRRGVNDAVSHDRISADHRIDGELKKGSPLNDNGAQLSRRSATGD